MTGERKLLLRKQDIRLGKVIVRKLYISKDLIMFKRDSNRALIESKDVPSI